MREVYNSVAFVKSAFGCKGTCGVPLPCIHLQTQFHTHPNNYGFTSNFLITSLTINVFENLISMLYLEFNLACFVIFLSPISSLMVTQVGRLNNRQWAIHISFALEIICCGIILDIVCQGTYSISHHQNIVQSSISRIISPSDWWSQRMVIERGEG